MRHLEFDDEGLAIRFQREGVEIDLVGFGKGYAVGRAIELMRENGVQSALLHGGTSSIATIGSPPEPKSWRIILQEPFIKKPPIDIELVDQGFSLSASHGKAFTICGKRFGHILNPQTGEPVEKTLAAVVTGTDAAVCEALSKSLMIHSSSWLQTLEERFPLYRCLIAETDNQLFRNIKT
jgi:FAD:protein FMN transferase